MNLNVLHPKKTIYQTYTPYPYNRLSTILVSSCQWVITKESITVTICLVKKHTEPKLNLASKKHMTTYQSVEVFFLPLPPSISISSSNMESSSSLTSLWKYFFCPHHPAYQSLHQTWSPTLPSLLFLPLLPIKHKQVTLQSYKFTNLLYLHFQCNLLDEPLDLWHSL